MRSYIIRRLLLIIPTIFIVSIIVFVMIRLIPGNIVDIMVSNFQDITKMDKQAIEQALGFNVPLYKQYLHWMGQILLHGNFGKSLVQSAGDE